MPAREVTSADLAVLRDRIADVLDELRADWNTVGDFSLARLQAMLASPRFRQNVFVDGGVIRGGAVWENTGAGWQLDLVVTQKTLTVAQRWAVVRALCRHAAQVAVTAGRPDEPFFGVTKRGGRIDLALQPLLPRRTVLGPESDPGRQNTGVDENGNPVQPLPPEMFARYVRYDSTASEMLLRIPA